MRPGTKAAALVFFGVAAVMGGLAWLLLSVGRATQEAPDGAPGSGKTTGRKGKREPRTMPLPPAPPQSIKPVERPNARFEAPGHPDLRYRDWKEIASAWLLIVDHPRSLVEGRGPDLLDEKTMERMAKTNERFMRAIAPVEGHERAPGLLVDHPAFAGNLVAAMLELKGAPLSDDQSRRIAELVAAQSQAADVADAELEKSRALEAVDRRTYSVDQMAERAKTADAFYDGLYAVLTPAQAEIVAPTEYRFRTSLDPVSSSRFWGFGISVVPIVDVDDGARAMSSGLAGQFGLVDREKEIREIVAPWLARDPLEPLDKLDERAAYSRRRAATARERMSELLHSLVAALDRDPDRPLPPATKAKIRDYATVFVPVRFVKK